MAIQSVGVVGAGQMGNGIAHVFALAGYDVLMTDISRDALDQAVALIDRNIERQVGRGKISAEEKAAAMARISTTLQLADLGKTDLIIANGSSYTVSVLTGKSDGTFNAKVDYATGNNPSSVTSADVNGDGKTDVVLGNERTPGVALINRGDGRSFESIRFGDGEGAVYGLAIGDVTGDGCPDIVAARSEARSALYRNSCR